MKAKTSKKFKGAAIALASLSVTCALAGNLILEPAVALAEEAKTGVKEYNYVSQYDSMEEVLDAGAALNIEMAAEGFVLMKNENNALPLSSSETNVTLLGSAASNPSIGGGGSGGLSTPGTSGGGPGTSPVTYTTKYSESVDLYTGLEASGFNINPRVRKVYDNLVATDQQYVAVGPEGSMFASENPRESGKYMDLVASGTDTSNYETSTYGSNTYKTITNGTLSGVESNYSLYDDAAILVFSRTGAEGYDNPSNNVEGHTDTSEHYLELDDAEKELVAYAKLHFSKIIVLINSPSVMELGDLQNDEDIDAILWIGQPGWNGMYAVGQVLTGKVNPSGHTVDFWMSDFTTDPTWYNSGDYTQAAISLGISSDKYSQYGIVSGSTIQMNAGQVGEGYAKFTSTENVIDYAEGIYMGYRYYETVAADLTAAGKDGEEWYEKNTVYPFGYGLSYTTFEQKITSVKGDLSDINGQVTVTVSVKNTGSVAGKDVVELYSTPPYDLSGDTAQIDKAAVNLVSYTKTSTIKPGKSETVSITIDVKDLASFDYNDANENGYEGYELEEGDYVLSIRSDSHTVLDETTLTASKSLNWGDADGDSSTPNAIYSQTTGTWAQYNTLAYNWTTDGENHYLTRDQIVVNGQVSDVAELCWLLTDSTNNSFNDAAVRTLNYRRSSSSNVYKDDINPMTGAATTDADTNPWVKTADDVKGYSQATTAPANGYDIKLYEMKDVAYDDYETWNKFLNQFTYDDLIALFAEGDNQNQGVENAGKPDIADKDGPAQLSGGWGWACEVVIASTWNVELAEQQGVLVGNESMWQGINGWYGPAMDIHRSPLSGRNFEYYSQDGVQGGMIAAAVIKGATSQGCHVYIKHAFMNDQETNRFGTATFATEQAIREIYAKCFELCITEGGANGIMTSFNLIGLQSSVSYATAYQLYTNEWGYTGFTCTDAYTDPNQMGWTGWEMTRGCVMPLGSLSKDSSYVYDLGKYDAASNTVKVGTNYDTVSYTSWYWVRETAKRVCYNIANGSGILNGTSSSLGYVNTLFTDVEVTAKVGDDLSKSLVSTDIDTIFGSVGYTITGVGNLPDGVSIENGKLVGTPTEGGTYNVALTLVGNYGLGYIKGTATLNLTIEDTITLSTADANKTFTFNNGDTSVIVTQSIINKNDTSVFDSTGKAADDGSNVGKYIYVKYSAAGLPEGLEIDEDTGKISGTPKVVGTYNVKVTVTLGKVVKKVTQAGGPGGPGDQMGGDNPGGTAPMSVVLTAENETAPEGGTEGGTEGGGFNMMGKTTYEAQDETYSATIVITIGGDAYNVVFNANGGAGSDQIFGYANTETANVSTLKVTEPTRDGGYTFAGWATSADASAKDAKALSELADVTSATTYYAIWEAPAVQIVNGYWYINGSPTGISATGTTGAAGANGTDGADGADGVSVTAFALVESTENSKTYRFTFSDGTTYDFTVEDGATGATGAAGEAGKDGTNGTNGTNGTDGVDGGSGSAVAGLVIGIVALVVAVGAAVVVVLLLKKKETK
jgi:beta-glucosidase